MDGRNPSGAVTSGIARKPPPTAEPPTSATASKRVICRPPLFSGSAAAGGGVVAAHAGTGARAASRNREGCVEPTLISPRTARCGVLRLVGLGRVSRAAVSGADSRAEHDGSRRGSRRSCRPCIVVGEEAQHALKMLHPTILELGDVCQEGASPPALQGSLRSGTTAARSSRAAAGSSFSTGSRSRRATTARCRGASIRRRPQLATRHGAT